MNAAGLKHLHVLTYNSTVASVSGKVLPGIYFKAKDQPDWLQDRKRPGLLLVRIPKVGDAKRIVSESRMERGFGFTIRTDRVCNVLVVNYLAKAPTYSSLASRAEGELRRRCR